MFKEDTVVTIMCCDGCVRVLGPPPQAQQTRWLGPQKLIYLLTDPRTEARDAGVSRAASS